MVAKKRASKRTSLQKKYKIQKRTKEHHKKLAKGKIVGTFKKKKVEQGIPNAWPRKDDLLKEIAVAKVRMEEVKQRKLEQRALQQSQVDEEIHYLITNLCFPLPLISLVPICAYILALVFSSS